MNDPIDHTIERRASPAAILPVIEKVIEKKVGEVLAPLPAAIDSNTRVTKWTALITALTPILLAVIAVVGSSMMQKNNEKLHEIGVNTDGRLTQMTEHIAALQKQLQERGGPQAPQSAQEAIESVKQ